MNNENGCERNFNGRFSGELGWEIVQQFTSEGPMNFFGELSNKFASEGCPIYLPEHGSTFENKNCFLIHGLGKCEGVGEDSRHGIGHVNIQVGSCICLNVFGCHYMCT